jgi:hypothetical protein
MTKPPRGRRESLGYDAPVKPDGTYRVLVDMMPGENAPSLNMFQLDYCCMPQMQTSSRLVQRLHAFADGATIDAIRKSGRAVEVLADAEDESRRAIAAAGPADRDRFEGGVRGPDLVGRLI